MANVLAELFQDTANAIREKTGDQGKMKPADFPEKIRAIEAGAAEAELYPLIVTENGIYYPKETVELGKTYTFRNNYTQEELQSLYEISLEMHEDGVFAWLFTVEDVGTIGIMHDYGMYAVYISDGHIWIPAEFAEEMGFTGGWNFGTDITDLTPAEIPTLRLVEDEVVIYTEDLSVLNPLFVLNDYDGFSRVHVNVEGSSGSSESGGGSASVIPLNVSKNGVYFPTENVEIGKTYTFRNDFTQEELQALYDVSTGKTDDGVFAWLFDVEDVGTIGIMHDYGMYAVYISDGHIWIPAEFAEEMGFTGGWNFGTDITDLTPTTIPTVTLVEDKVVIYTEDLSVLNPLFVLKKYDGFSHVEVNVKNMEGRMVKVTSGEYTTETEFDVITINHGLGYVPDMIIIQLAGSSPNGIPAFSLLNGTFLSPNIVYPADTFSYYHITSNTSGSFATGASRVDFRENNSPGESYINNANAISFDVCGYGFIRHAPGAKYRWTAFGNMM